MTMSKMSSAFLALCMLVIISQAFGSVVRATDNNPQNGDVGLYQRNGDDFVPSETSQGWLLVYYNGQWGTVCDDGFNYQAVRAACTQMGYTDRIRMIILHLRHQTRHDIPILLDDIRCPADAPNISACVATWGRHNCGQTEEISIDCAAPNRG